MLHVFIVFIIFIFITIKLGMFGNTIYELKDNADYFYKNINIENGYIINSLKYERHHNILSVPNPSDLYIKHIIKKSLNPIEVHHINIEGHKKIIKIY